jgi:hypothetical protein
MDTASGWRHPRLTLLTALSAWFGLGLQLWLSFQLAVAGGRTWVDGLVAYLGYFTVLTNLLVALTLSVALLWPAGHMRRWMRQPSLASAVAVSIALVGLGYHVLLRHIWSPQGLQWVADITLHYVTPLLCVLHWWWAVPPARMAWQAPLSWAAWPLAYLVYALWRGHWLQTYPYPFIDVNAIGYPHALLNALGLLAVFLVVGLAFVALARWRLRPPWH